LFSTQQIDDRSIIHLVSASPLLKLRLLFKVPQLFAILLVVGCASVEKPTVWTVEEFHAKAQAHLDAGEWEQAIDYYHQLEQRYPYGKYTEQSQLEVIYAYYRNREPELAISSAEQFIRLYPTHPRIDYAYYLKALSIFQSPTSQLYRLSRVDPSRRDPGPARESFEAFQALITLFPKSSYAKNSRQKMAGILDLIAQHEINIGRYYLGRGANVAALNRAKYVIERYPDVSAVEDALGIMVSVYKQMGFDTLLDDTIRILQKNYPASIYLSLDSK
jgi:outer membrane protein assembly factor BamD